MITMRKPLSRPLAQRIPLPLLVLLILVSMPVMVPLALVQHAWVERRKRQRVATFRCVRCGVVLGPAALALAEAKWSAHVAKLHREHPHVKFRLQRTVWAVCPGCGQAYDYEEATNNFSPRKSED